ncbi:cell division cycle 48 ATPase [Hamiltosporidium tvaerminnensis]|uniref:Cell division cycle 48 ATPase n=2 Tax=Hamiltosporidium TaxID=1176354 RepID=A0A4Q9L3A5_9MICR|nr:cell division cycle 48 ATPase [Hamiltosporidium tvaerminnensis]
MLHTKKDNNTLIRNKILSEHLKKTTIPTSHPFFCDLKSFHYLKPQVNEFLKASLMTNKSDIDVPRSLLFYGPSGVGKSYLVNSISSQYNLPIYNLNIETSKDVSDMFKKAAFCPNSLIFIDSLHLVTENRLTILQKIRENISLMNTGIVICTSHTKNEDLKNIFDYDIMVRIPTEEERREIICDLIKEVKPDLNNSLLNDIAKRTPGFVPGDLKRLFRRSIAKSIAEKTELNYEIIDLSLKEMRKETSAVTFDDVGALEEVKSELQMSIILPSQYPHKFKRLGINRPSGVLLYGPPGCGKTMLAKAVSNLSHCNFISVKGPELISKYVGDSEKEIRDLFYSAKMQSPCVIFFDEIDSLCLKRGNNEFTSRIVNQILTLMDGLEDRGEVYIIGATNRINSIDSALLRPGRFDKIIEVPMPNKEECYDIFKKCLKDVPIESFDIKDLELYGLSGAEICGVVREAAMLCLKDNFDVEDLKIGIEYFNRALSSIKRKRNLDLDDKK